MIMSLSSYTTYHTTFHIKYTRPLLSLAPNKRISMKNCPSAGVHQQQRRRRRRRRRQQQEGDIMFFFSLWVVLLTMMGKQIVQIHAFVTPMTFTVKNHPTQLPTSSEEAVAALVVRRSFGGAVVCRDCPRRQGNNIFRAIFMSNNHNNDDNHSPNRRNNSESNIDSNGNTNKGLSVGIVGAGAIALATAAVLSEAGHSPMLWSPSGRIIKNDNKSKAEVTVTGKIDMSFSPRIATSAAELVQNNKVIMLCLPANGHKYVMEEISPFLLPEQHSVIISSHASFGALYLSQLVNQRHTDDIIDSSGGLCRVPITAWGTTVATARQSIDGVRINTIRNAIDITTIPAAFNGQAIQLCQQLFPQINNFVLRNGLVAIALSNLNPQNHLGIAIGNISRMERGEEWYQSLHITPAIGRLLEGLDAERLAIADYCHVNVKTIFEHFSLSFHVPQTDNISEMNQEIHALGNDVLGPNTAESRYILEDVPFGLVPTIVMGRLVGKPALLHEAGVTLISSMYGRDFTTENDLLEALNLGQYTLEDLQRAGETGVLCTTAEVNVASQTESIAR